LERLTHRVACPELGRAPGARHDHGVELSRRHLLGLIPALALSPGTAAARIAPEPVRPVDPWTFRTVEITAGKGSSQRRALVVVPSHLDPNGAHPLAVLLHGYAQAKKPGRALAAWPREYALEQAY